MLGLGAAEIGIIALIVLAIWIIPAQIPKIGKNLGEGLREFRNLRKTVKETTDDLR